MSITVLLVDGHKIFREGVRSLLEKEPDIEVVGEVGDGLKALELVRQLIPDIVVTNRATPKLKGIDVTRQIVSQFPEIRIICLSMDIGISSVSEMLNAGATGYVSKACTFEEIVEAVRTVAEGGTYLSRYLEGIY